MSIHKYDASNDELTRLAGGTLWADAPVGAIIPYGGADAPAGWMICQGQAVSRTTYPELFAVIGTAFGSGDGSTTFNIPDMRESVPKGAGLTGHTVGNHLDANGLAVGEFLDDRVQNHNHNVGAAASGGSSKFGLVKNAATLSYEEPTGGTQTGRTGDTTEVKSVGVNYIIKAKMCAMPSDFMNKVDEAVVDTNEYSTDEVAIGKWIDGKTIYRKVITDLNFGNKATQWLSTGATLSNVDTLINCYALRSDKTVFHFDFRIEGSTIVYNQNLADYSTPQTESLIVEYTKTTDG